VITIKRARTSQTNSTFTVGKGRREMKEGRGREREIYMLFVACEREGGF